MVSATPESFDPQAFDLVLTDPAEVAAQPHPGSYLRRHLLLLPSVAQLWARREIVLRLAERDLRASYKQASLGVAWAVLGPLATLAVMVLVFRRVNGFHIPHVPYVLYAYAGLLPWQCFASSLSQGANSLLANKALLAKVQFPRECFPLAQVLEAIVNSALASSVLVVLFLAERVAPKPQTAWLPLLLAIEVAFALGAALALSALLVHVRDLVQVMPLVVQIGLFANPVIWPFSRVPAYLRPVYSLFDPLAPVIDGLRRTMLLGESPDWSLTGLAALGALGYLLVGYAVFKYLEADLADIA